MKNRVCRGIIKPWKFDTITEKQFIDSANSGDLLLFRGSSKSSKLTRTVLNSYFDHVALVLKFEADKDEIYIVEATGNMGVALNRWSNIRSEVGPDKFY